MRKYSMQEMEYYFWLCEKIIQEDSQWRWSKLLGMLFDTDYIWVIPMDENRSGDGIWQRREFCQEKKYTGKLLRNVPCSVLEMLVALCERVEDNVMYDWDEGDRTGKWFWILLENMGLLEFDNDHFDELEVCKILDIFMNREYKNGEIGCPFLMKKMGKKAFETFKNEEIWNQILDYFSCEFGV